MAKSQADMIKIGVAVVALLGASFLLLKNFTSIFDGKPQGAKNVSPEREKEIEEQIEEQERIQKQQVEDGVIEIGGA